VITGWSMACFRCVNDRRQRTKRMNGRASGISLILLTKTPVREQMRRRSQA
jgi:hypothetical protein